MYERYRKIKEREAIEAKNNIFMKLIEFLKRTGAAERLDEMQEMQIPVSERLKYIDQLRQQFDEERR